MQNLVIDSKPPYWKDLLLTLADYAKWGFGSLLLGSLGFAAYSFAVRYPRGAFEIALVLIVSFLVQELSRRGEKLWKFGQLVRSFFVYGVGHYHSADECLNLRLECLAAN